MPKSYASAPAMSIDTAKKYTAVIDTNRGKITVDLFPKEAPNTVNNFVFLARDKFYDGIKFHRVIPDFMVQTGDPEGKRHGGPHTVFGQVRDQASQAVVNSIKQGDVMNSVTIEEA